MSEEVKNFIDKMAQNDMVGAGDAFKDALRSKVGDALILRLGTMCRYLLLGFELELRGLEMLLHAF